MYRIIPSEKNPVLRRRAHDVAPEHITTPRIQRIIAEMKDILSKEPYGVALAAPQIGESLRLFIVSGKALNIEDAQSDAQHDSAPPPPDEVYINPVITKMSRAKTDKHEGCLSIRGMWGEVPRAQKVAVRAFDERGRAFTRGASGFLAHIFQHEIDHLDGILYTDKAKKIYSEQDAREH